MQNEKAITAFIEHTSYASALRDIRGDYIIWKGRTVKTDGATLWSYDTPIAKWQNGKAYVATRKYSRTTSKLQSALIRALEKANKKVMLCEEL